VLSGQVNTRLTRWLVNGGIDALGMSGVDLGLVRVEPLRPSGLDIGFVGRVVGVRAEPLHLLLANGIVPVISPISLGVDGLSYNVNADQVAAALAVGLGAGRLIFVSNVPGVLIDGALAPQLARAAAQHSERRGAHRQRPDLRRHGAQSALSYRSRSGRRACDGDYEFGRAALRSWYGDR